MAGREEAILLHAKMTMAAEKNPYGSVEKVFPLAINSYVREGGRGYLGIKNVSAIPAEAVERLKRAVYALHTLGRASFGGRAVDMGLANPVTGCPMTGSSSGTAVNVFLHFNDLGLGTDGGGSVLAPAMSLNLYGFISPLFCTEVMKKREKRSTDGISFFPSLGLIAREYEELARGVEALLDLPDDGAEAAGAASEPPRVYRVEKDGLYQGEKRLGPAPDPAGGRRELIAFLMEVLPQCDWLISREGPVDVKAMGDSIFGHFDEETAREQRQSGKGLLRVVNMAGASALTMPESALGCAGLWICRSEPETVRRMLAAAAGVQPCRDEMTEWYFGNLDQYLDGGAFTLQ